MKTILTTALLFVFFHSFAQDCEKLIVEKVDKVTGKSSISSTEPIIISNDGGKTGFEVFLYLSPQSDAMMLWLTVNGAGPCVDEGDQINILFTDDTRLTLKYRGDFRCDPILSMLFGGYAGKLDELQQLKTKKIATLRASTRGDVMQMDLTDEQATLLMNSLACLADRLK